MKRTPMKPRTEPMRRTRFESTRPGTLSPQVKELSPEPRRAGPEYRYAKPQVAALFRPAPKDEPLQHPGYAAIVRKMECAMCGTRGFTQLCHADIVGVGGKGKSIKSDIRLAWPGCGPHGDEPGCHWYVGTSGKMPKAERHDFERDAGAATRVQILLAGKWPPDLPYWPADQIPPRRTP